MKRVKREREGESFIDKEYRLSRRCWEERLPLLSAPRLYGERVPVKLLRTSNSKVRQKIVDTHNYLRTQVKPPAANMLVMVSHLCMFRTSYFCSNFKFRSSFVRTYPCNRCTFSNMCLNDIILLYFIRDIRKESNDNNCNNL